MNLKKKFGIRWLVFAVLITTAVSTVTFSRYLSEVSATATATVAKWEVSVATDDNNPTSYELTSEKDAEWKLTVTSLSDVTVEYDVVVHIPEALAGKVSCSLEHNQTVTIAEDKKTYTFAKAGTISHDAKNKTNTHTLKVAGSDFTNAITTTEKITVDVIARQVD